MLLKFRSLWRLCVVGLLLGTSSALQADASLKPFDRDSYASIQAQYLGQPLLVSLWSLDCPPCIKELRSLATWRQQYPDLNLVLISTDGLAQQDEASRHLVALGLASVDNWIFADPSAARLRYSIDPRWHGELPRSYLYSIDHPAAAISGILSEQAFQQWLAQNQRQPTQRAAAKN